MTMNRGREAVSAARNRRGAISEVVARDRRAAAAGALAAALLACGLVSPAAALPPEPAVRCFEMIGLFDRIVQSRFDHRLLQIESWELAEAQKLRAQAEADCARGQSWFGTRAIEDALTILGVVPPTAFEEEGD